MRVPTSPPFTFSYKRRQNSIPQFLLPVRGNRSHLVQGDWEGIRQNQWYNAFKISLPILVLGKNIFGGKFTFRETSLFSSFWPFFGHLWPNFHLNNPLKMVNFFKTADKQCIFIQSNFVSQWSLLNYLLQSISPKTCPAPEKKAIFYCFCPLFLGYWAKSMVLR